MADMREFWLEWMSPATIKVKGFTSLSYGMAADWLFIMKRWGVNEDNEEKEAAYS
jgi:hypothetical protein